MSWTFTADDGEQVHYDVPPQVAELEDKLQKATDNYDSACRQISFMAERMERFETLQPELTTLKTLLRQVWAESYEGGDDVFDDWLAENNGCR